MESAHLVKVFAILEATAGLPGGLPLTELASLVGLPKSTAHRLLKTLCTLGYMTNCGRGVYRQTSMIKRLAIGVNDPHWIAIAEPVMKQLYELTEETINLAILRFEKIFYLHVIETKKTLRRAVAPMMSDPCFSTALGRAIIAFLPDDRQHFLLRHATIEKRTPHTIVDPAKIKRILKEVASEGVAYEEDQTDLGVACVAAPVYDNEGVVAAISLSAPQVRLDKAKISRWKIAVRESAQTISSRLQSSESLK